MANEPDVVDESLMDARRVDSFKDPYVALTGGIVGAIRGVHDNVRTNRREEFADSTWRAKLSAGADPYSVAMPVEEMLPHVQRTVQDAEDAVANNDPAKARVLMSKVDSFAARPLTARSLQEAILSPTVPESIKAIANGALSGVLGRKTRAALSEDQAAMTAQQRVAAGADPLTVGMPAASLLPHLKSLMEDAINTAQKGNTEVASKQVRRLESFLSTGRNALQLRNLMNQDGIPEEAKQIAGELYTGRFQSKIKDLLNPATNPMSAFYLTTTYPGFKPDDVSLIQKAASGVAMNPRERAYYAEYLQPQLRSTDKRAYMYGDAPSSKQSDTMDYALSDGSGMTRGKKAPDVLQRDFEEAYTSKRNIHQFAEHRLAELTSADANSPEFFKATSDLVKQFYSASGENEGLAREMLGNDISLVRTLMKSPEPAPSGMPGADQKPKSDLTPLDMVTAFGRARVTLMQSGGAALADKYKLPPSQLISLSNGAFDSLTSALQPGALANMDASGLQAVLESTASSFANTLEEELKFSPVNPSGGRQPLSEKAALRARSRAAYAGVASSLIGNNPITISDKARAEFERQEASFQASATLAPDIERARADEAVATSIQDIDAASHSRLEQVALQAVNTCIVDTGLAPSQMSPEARASARERVVRSLTGAIGVLKARGARITNEASMVQVLADRAMDPAAFNAVVVPLTIKIAAGRENAELVNNLLAIPDLRQRAQTANKRVESNKALLAAFDAKFKTGAKPIEYERLARETEVLAAYGSELEKTTVNPTVSEPGASKPTATPGAPTSSDLQARRDAILASAKALYEEDVPGSRIPLMSLPLTTKNNYLAQAAEKLAGHRISVPWNLINHRATKDYVPPQPEFVTTMDLMDTLVPASFSAATAPSGTPLVRGQAVAKVDSTSADLALKQALFGPAGEKVYAAYREGGKDPDDLRSAAKALGAGESAESFLNGNAIAEVIRLRKSADAVRSLSTNRNLVDRLWHELSQGKLTAKEKIDALNTIGEYEAKGLKELRSSRYDMSRLALQAYGIKSRASLTQFANKVKAAAAVAKGSEFGSTEDLEKLLQEADSLDAEYSELDKLLQDTSLSSMRKSE